MEPVSSKIHARPARCVRRCIGLLPCLTVSWFAAAPPEDIGALLQSVLVEFPSVPALAAVVTTSDQTLAAGAVGLRIRGRPETPVTVHDRFHIGSCTKSMTAVLVAMLVERGTLSWSEPLSQGFPGMDLAPGFGSVTLRDLLAHRAGLPTDIPPHLWARIRESRESGRAQRRFLAEAVLGTPPAHAPHTRTEYANLGYAIAGAWIENRTGRGFEEILKHEVFEPLDLDRAGFGPPAAGRGEAQPWGHSPEPVPPDRFADNPAALGPAGRVHLPVLELARYIRVHLDGVECRRLGLDGDALRHLHTPFPDGAEYALGWVVLEREWAQGRALMHTGSNKSFFSVIWLAPARGLGFAVLANAAPPEAEQACDRVAARLVERYCP
jgi:CubicO group peptidase (beta-lactamase class C family)